jgi:hypothetical protein
MGTWGPGIFSNDTASDVRADFRELIEDGLGAEQATAKILRQYRAAVNDPDEATALWTGLAATQFRLGRLQPDVRDRALSLIDGGSDLHLWEGSTSARVMALDKLRSQLLGPQRMPVTLRRRRSIASPVRAGEVFTLRIDENRHATCRVLAVQHDRYADCPVVELIDEHGKAYEDTDTFPELLELRSRTTRKPARWVVVPTRRADMPTANDLVVVGHRRPPVLGADAQSYTSWPMLREACRRILADPDSRPRGRRPRLFPR